MVIVQVSNDISIDNRSCHKTERLDSDSDRDSVHSHVIFRAYDDSYSPPLAWSENNIYLSLGGISTNGAVVDKFSGTDGSIGDKQ